MFFLIPALGVDVSLEFRWGLLLFYTFFGVFVGFFGLLDKHPLLDFKMPFWFRGILMGVFMHLLLILLAYDQMNAFMAMDMVQSMGLISPYWALIDGAILGFLMDFVATKHAGEGNLPLK